MDNYETLILPTNLQPYADGIMIHYNDVVDHSLTGYSDWTLIPERSVYSYLYKYVYSINTGTELWALGSQTKIVFTTE